ncbi:MAG TPA: cytochrome c/FTR1 family iron permease [Gemmatimonadales bacterium]|jgi:high-affinity iron transporter|nr:cytochrome c/FTR1 family iron permease [Gemmatimonadales bacterium]
MVSAISLAAKEYRNGVPAAGGRITAPEEVAEARLFLDQAEKDVATLPDSLREPVGVLVAGLRTSLDRPTAPAPDSVAQWADVIVKRIAAAFGDALNQYPAVPPSVAQGMAVFQQQCASCHGRAGRGDGPAGRGLNPPPANLADPAEMRTVTPIDVYRKVTIGVPGTAMPRFDGTLTDADRWAVTAYVATLVPDAKLIAAFATVRVRLDSAVAHRSADQVFDAYLAFEQVETEVRARNAPLASALEDEFANLRTRAAAGAEAAELAGIRQQILAGLERAEREVADRDSRANLFLESLGITLREGFEAILIIGALMAFLAKAGAVERRRDVAWGAWFAVFASLATFAGVELLFEVTSNQREALEGWTMLLATIVLFYVSYWLLSKVEADKWSSFVRDKVKSALSSGSRWALAGVAFLAVYREGFETILFYKALASGGGTGAAAAVVAGLAVGCVGLVLIYLAINLFGMRLPLRPFFAVTGGLLYYMAFVFAGKGIAELQNAGVVGMRPVEWGPRLPALGIYPTAQSLSAQGALLALALVAVVWAVVKRPRPA